MADNLQINVVSSQSTPVVMEEKKLVLKILSSVAGAKGDSMYQIAVKHGYTGTEEEFIETYMRSVVDNVYDISASHLVEGQPSEYADLATALGSGGENIPSDLQLGGMSVKFIESTGHTYVQYRLTKNTFSTNVADWQGIDDIPTVGSDNLVKSGGVYKELAKRLKWIYDNSDADFNVGDVEGNVLLEIKGGHIRLKNFDSRNVFPVYECVEDGFFFVDGQNNIGMRLDVSGNVYARNISNNNNITFKTV